jgi:uncharacterized protein YbaR (Trm112 family)
MIDPALLEILCCPETHQGLTLADPALVELLNQQIAAGQLRNRKGQAVNQKVDAGLVRADGKVVYLVRSGIPIMLIDQAILLTSASAQTPQP